jgi:aconitate hydratase
MLTAPPANGQSVNLEKGPNIQSLPIFEELLDSIQAPVIIKTNDDISTDAIMPAGSRVLPYRSNIPEIARFTFYQIDETFYDRAQHHKESGSIIIGGANYGQGSSREHAAIAPRYLGVRAVIAKSFARIHFQNLVNFGILPLTFISPSHWDGIDQDDVLLMNNLRKSLKNEKTLNVQNRTKNFEFKVQHNLSERQVEIILDGGLINMFRKRFANPA